jgi:hypothetical protein
MFKSRVFLVSGLTVLAGCATTTGVQKVGADTYMISSHASAVRGGTGRARALVLEDANKFCASLGQEI